MGWKLAAAAIIILCCYAIGIAKSRAVYARVRQMEEVEDGLALLAGELRCMLLPLDEAFAAAGKTTAVFADAATYLAQMDAQDAMRKAAAVHTDGAVRDALYSFAAGLSADDVQGQLANIALCQTRIAHIRTNAAAECAKQQRLYAGAGIPVGIIIVILVV